MTTPADANGGRRTAQGAAPDPAQRPEAKAACGRSERERAKHAVGPVGGTTAAGPADPAPLGTNWETTRGTSSDTALTPSLLHSLPSPDLDLFDESAAAGEVSLCARVAIFEAAQALTSRDSTRQCAKATAPVLVTRKRLQAGNYAAGLTGGLIRCGSLWSCPFCSAPERFARATMMDRHITALLGSAHTIGFMVLTFSDQDMPVVDAMKALKGYLRKFWSTEFAAKLETFGLVGRIRSIEVTMRDDGTGHPHAQFVLVCSGVLTPAEFDRFAGLLRNRWLTVTGSKPYDFNQGTLDLFAEMGIDPSKVPGVPVADLHAGFRMERVGLDDNGKCVTLARYMAKGSESWTIGAEFNREDVKRSRSAQTYAPFDLLRAYIDTEDLRFRRIWQAYEEATEGVAQLLYSKGFRSYCDALADAADPTPTTTGAPVPLEDNTVTADANQDDEIEDTYDAGEGHRGFVTVEAKTWNWIRSRRLMAQFLIEVGRFPEGDDPIPHFEEWLHNHGAPDDVAIGFSPPAAGSE